MWFKVKYCNNQICYVKYSSFVYLKSHPGSHILLCCGDEVHTWPELFSSPRTLSSWWHGMLLLREVFPECPVWWNCPLHASQHNWCFIFLQSTLSLYDIFVGYIVCFHPTKIYIMKWWHLFCFYCCCLYANLFMHCLAYNTSVILKGLLVFLISI